MLIPEGAVPDSSIRRKNVTRRDALKLGVLAAAGSRFLSGQATMAESAPATRPARSKATSFVRRPDLLDEAVRDRLELIQLTTDPEVGGSHIYMEAPVFTPGSRQFVLQRSGHPHGSDRNDPNHQFLLCDIEDNCSLHPLTDELGTTGPAVSPDGQYLYYFVDETTRRRGNRAILKRVRLDGTERMTLMVIDHDLPGTSFRPSRLYPLATISSDGKRLAISALLTKRVRPEPFGLLVFDLERPSVELIIHGPTWSNMHPQYCLSLDPELGHDILIQENHEQYVNEKGERVRAPNWLGADIHVIRDDGTNFRDLPWGRDGNEYCQGHQCWRGRTGWAITSTQVRKSAEAQLIESLPVPAGGHIGLNTPGGVRNNLSRTFPDPHFHHFATDIAGERFITDAEPFTPEGRIMFARLGEPGRDPLGDWTCIARPRSSGQKSAHLHPFLSPDGTMAFFNSDESGRCQAYMVRGL